MFEVGKVTALLFLLQVIYNKAGVETRGFAREFTKFSREIWITEFGSVNIFPSNFEFKLWINSKLKRKSLFELVGLHGKVNGPAHGAQRSAQAIWRAGPSC